MARDAMGGPADLLIETAGGWTGATEKIVSILRGLLPDLRVIVPCRAKSNGTMLALVGNKIVMGACSELGPADPFIQIAPNNMVPAHFLVNVQGVDPIISQLADHAIKQTRQLATTLLKTGMMQGKDPKAIEAVVEALTSRRQYH